MRELIRSRKFWATMTLVIIIAGNKVGGSPLDNATVTTLTIAIASWVIGQAVVDSRRTK